MTAATDTDLPTAASKPTPRPIDDYPDIMRSKELAEYLRIHEKTVLVAAAKGDRSKIPLPFALRPYRWRKRDVKAWTDDTNETDQRRALMRRRG